jgi:GTP-binding protein
MHGSGGVGDLLDVVIWKIDELYPGFAKGEWEPEEKASEPIKLAIVGRPNVGKSSILNAMAGEERVIVSDISGTTRDAIDIEVSLEDQQFVLVDTAGIRKKGKVDYGVEMFSVDRSIKALRRSDVSILVIDAQEGVTDQDKRIIETSNEAGRGLILVVNKWDLLPNKGPNSTSNYKKDLWRDVPHARFAPVIFTSAKTGQRLNNILKEAKVVFENAHRRAKTNLVNQVLMESFILSPPPPQKNKRLKMYYATQVSVAPPTFVLFVNDAKLMKESYMRYLEKKLRESFAFEGTPVVIIPRNRTEKSQ